MAQVSGPESGISCMIQFVADSPDGEYRARIIAPTESNNVLDTASFSSLDDALSWIGKVFPEQTVRWKANRLFPPADMEEETLRDVVYFIPDPSHGAEADRMNLKQMHRRVDEVYNLVRQLPRFDHLTPKDKLPANGIYIFFEQGESAVWRG